MALSDTGTDVKERKEPVPRDTMLDRAGNLARGWFNWFQGQDRLVGEIVSGVNRNRQNIVQLETDYQAADGTITSAYIAADAVVAADATSARATLETNLRAETQRPNLLPQEYWIPKEGDGPLWTITAGGSFGDTSIKNPYLPETDSLKINATGASTNIYVSAHGGSTVTNMVLPPGRYGLKLHFAYNANGGPALSAVAARLADSAA